MPYRMAYRRGQARPWKILKDGKVVGSSKTSREAQASIRARRAAEHGAKLDGKRKGKR